MKNLVYTILYVLCVIFNSNAESSIVFTPTSTIANNYVLYLTTNIYTFLKLDTRNEKICNLQYSMDENEFEVALNSRELVTNGKTGQCSLYPTSNIWIFILLNTINGDTYYVQWSQD